MGIGLLGPVRVGGAGERAEAGGAADDRFVETLPEGARPHEGLVIEPGGEEWRENVVDRHRVEPERGPAVLAAGDQAVVDLLHRGAGIGRDVDAGADGDQRVRLVRPGSDRAPRAVILEGPAHEPDVVRQQRGGDRIARETRHGFPVEAEGDRLRPVDQPLAIDPHLRASASVSVRAVTWVTVSRSATSQVPQGP